MLADAYGQIREPGAAWNGSHSANPVRVTVTMPAGSRLNQSGVSWIVEVPPSAVNPFA